LPVEESRPQRGYIDAFEAAGIDADPVRMQPRRVEGMNAAIFAKGVLRRIGIELVGGQRILATQQLKIPPVGW
jgi:hypothetical protein